MHDLVDEIRRVICEGEDGEGNPLPTGARKEWGGKSFVKHSSGKWAPEKAAEKAGTPKKPTRWQRIKRWWHTKKPKKPGETLRSRVIGAGIGAAASAAAGIAAKALGLK